MSINNAPDPADIARLANAFFIAVPGAAPDPAAAVDRLDLSFSPTIEAPAVSSSLAPRAGISPVLEEAPGPERGALTVFAAGAPSGMPHVWTSPLSARGEPPTPVDSSRPAPRSVPEGTETSSVPTAQNIPGPYEFLPVVVSEEPSAGFEPKTARRDFPILNETVEGRPLVWLDNAATTQKPRAVIDRLVRFYEHENSNVHRAAHTLAARATDAYEGARESARRFLNAASAQEILFVRGATEGINLVAQTWARRCVQRGDDVVITWLEHHANIVPWQMLCAERGARLRVVPVNDRGEILLGEYEKLMGPRTRIVSLTQVSNALGTVVPVAEMIALAHKKGARVLVDGAQSVSHMPVDVQALDADFFVFSGHKVFGPTGIGVVYGKGGILADTPPWQGGGNMIKDVTFERTIFQAPPARFEAGTGNIADAAGLSTALDYVRNIGLDRISRHEHALLAYGTEALLKIPGLKIIGTAREKAGVLSFVLDGHRTEDVGKALSRRGIAVRAGHHCAQPILRRFGLESTVRASFAFYNTTEDIDALASALQDLTRGKK